MAGERGDEYQNPLAITTDDLDDKQVRVTIIIPPLTVKRNFFKGFSLEPANAEILPKFETRSLTVIAHVKLKDATIVNYRVHIRKLPKEIVPERCSYAVKKEMIILTLIKKEAQSWAAKLSESGLEQASDEET